MGIAHRFGSCISLFIIRAGGAANVCAGPRGGIQGDKRRPPGGFWGRDREKLAKVVIPVIVFAKTFALRVIVSAKTDVPKPAP
mgnify:CR=1 FL=1